MAVETAAENTQKERRSRASRPKVRTGCHTCKVRHKKCDESRPSCSMCTRTGRRCEYRETPDKRTRVWRADKTPRLEEEVSPDTPAKQISFFGPLMAPVDAGQVGLRSDERWYLDYFRKSTSIQCAAYFYDEFWQRLVHQACHHQPAVRHAAIGMAALNWEFMNLRLGRNCGRLDRSVSLHQTNKAIAYLRQNLMDDRMGPLRVEVALISCIILVNVILFQEGADVAGRHLRSGSKLLEQYLNDHSGRSTVGPILRQVFANSHLIWSTFTDPAAFSEDDDAALRFPVPDTYSAPMHDYEKESDFMTTLARLVIQSHSRGFSVGPVTSELNEEPITVLFKLRAWKSQMKGAFAIHKDRVPDRHLEALAVFEVWDEVLRIIFAVETQPPPRELMYDATVETFRKAVQIAKNLLTFSSDLSSLPTFYIRRGVIPPLFFCAFRCRDWFIRREALTLLQQWSKKDSVSTVSATTRVLERLVELESEGLTLENVIPEANRIEAVIVKIPPGASKLQLQYRRTRSPEMNTVSQTDAMHWVSEWLPYQGDKDI